MGNYDVIVIDILNFTLRLFNLSQTNEEMRMFLSSDSLYVSSVTTGIAVKHPNTKLSMCTPKFEPRPQCVREMPRQIRYTLSFLCCFCCKIL